MSVKELLEIIEIPPIKIKQVQAELANALGYIEMLRHQLFQTQAERDRYKTIVENIRNILK